MPARLLRIEGRVQGVGYRDWLCREAARLGLTGWVRNRPDGSVQALVDGAEDAQATLIAACRRGPLLARVERVEQTLSDPPPGPGFHRLPTG